MAAITSAVVVAAGSAYAANRQASAAKDAASQANKGAMAGIDEQRRQFDAFQGNIQPYLGAGTTALSGLEALAKGDYSAFQNSPDYVYARQQAQDAIEAGAANRGSLYSPATQVDLAGAVNGLASQNLGSYRSSLMDLARLGQNSAVGAGSLGQSSANSISGLYGQIGQNNANSTIGQANAWSDGLAGIAGAVGQYYGGRNSSYQTPAPAQAGWGSFTPNQNTGTGTGYSSNPVVTNSYSWMT